MQVARAEVSMKRLGAVLVVLFSGVLLACQLDYLLPTPGPSAAPRATRTKTPGSPGSTSVPTSPGRPALVPTSPAPQVLPTSPSGPAPILGTAKENLRVRAAPSASAQQIGSLNKGATVQIVGRSAASDWLQILLSSSPTVLGWIATSFVDVKGSVTAIPVVDSGSVPAPQPYPGQPPAPQPRPYP